LAHHPCSQAIIALTAVSDPLATQITFGMTTPKRDAEQPVSETCYAAYIRQVGLCIGYIVVSSTLIRFNKWMMQADHFPHSLALSAFHMMVTTFMCSCTYMIAPSMFVSMATATQNRADIVKLFFPIGVCFALMLFGSNQAYSYCSVAFLQFMKEGNVIVVFLISCALGLQHLTRLRLLVILWVIVGSSMAVSGELAFSMTGFMYQASSQVAECMRMVMGEIVLSGRKIDPLTYTFFLAPVCLAVLLCANALHWNPYIIPAFLQWWPLLIVNALVAFVLNLLVAAVIKECSAVGFVLAGLLKDIAIVVCSCIAFGEKITAQQATAFALTLAGVGFWSYMKTCPQAPAIRAAERMVCVPQAQEPNEFTNLVEKKV